MTRLLEKAFGKASKLPPKEQDALAATLLAELASEEKWAHAFEANGASDALSKLADEALNEHRSGNTEPLDPIWRLTG